MLTLRRVTAGAAQEADLLTVDCHWSGSHLAWFAVSGTMGTKVWQFHGRKHPWTVYFCNV